MAFTDKLSNCVGSAPIGSFFYNCPQHIFLTSPYYSGRKPTDSWEYVRSEKSRETQRVNQRKRTERKRLEIEALFLR